jgi:beta-alanine--pyruvate transaminase|tara:strand:+ start:6356 stop:7690 length:1335 start_codon:yes stop_codon:yes gene_type:complete
MKSKQSKLSQAQLDAHWMPFTGNRQFKKDPRIIASADGAYYFDQHGRKIFDGLSGLWTCGLGHNIPEINDAVTQQLKTLDYSPAFQFGHEKSFQLAEQITEFMPAGLNRVFFTNSGSDAVETSLKMARAYWRAKGHPEKTVLIGRQKGYHGVNYGGLSVGGIPNNKIPFGDGLASDHLTHTITDASLFSKGQPKQGAELADELLDLIKQHDATNIAAVIVEPVAGSAGVIPPPVGYLDRLRQICSDNNILLIFDEVICAFGRLGTKTGAEAFGVTPDIMTIAKQVTNGSIPLGAAVVRQEIYDTFMDTDAPEYMLEFAHGYTYSAHPVACAAGLATLNVIEQQQLIPRVAQTSMHFESSVHELKHASNVTDIRNYGLAAGITLAPHENEPAKRPYEVAMKMWDKGFYVRYGGDTIQLGLPFIVDKHEVDLLMTALDECLNSSSN